MSFLLGVALGFEKDIEFLLEGEEGGVFGCLGEPEGKGVLRFKVLLEGDERKGGAVVRFDVSWV